MLDTVTLRVGCSGYCAYPRATLKFQAPVTLNLKKKVPPSPKQQVLAWIFVSCVFQGGNLLYQISVWRTVGEVNTGRWKGLCVTLNPRTVQEGESAGIARFVFGGLMIVSVRKSS